MSQKQNLGRIPRNGKRYPANIALTVLMEDGAMKIVVFALLPSLLWTTETANAGCHSAPESLTPYVPGSLRQDGTIPIISAVPKGKNMTGGSCYLDVAWTGDQHSMPKDANWSGYLSGAQLTETRAVKMTDGADGWQCAAHLPPPSNGFQVRLHVQSRYCD